MSSRAKKLNELPSANTVGSNDRFIIEKVDGANTTTSVIEGSMLKSSIFVGPYDDDPGAAGAGVNVGEPYYTSSGDVKVRLV